MRHLNYNHLLYFWTVAREGSIAAATEVLNLAPQTISGQLKVLEASVGQSLLRRAGRGLELTDYGRLVFHYCDEIFTLGGELAQRVKTKSLDELLSLNVGLVNSIPKLVAYRILEPVTRLNEAMRVVCVENDLDALLGELAIHNLDLIVSDRPIPSGMSIRAFNHELGSSSISFFASEKTAEDFKKGFPNCLNDAPILLPTPRSALRGHLDNWLGKNQLRPRIVAEFDDSALMKAFGAKGVGLFPAPSAAAEEIEYMYRCSAVGHVASVKERYYALSPERKLKHPEVIRITEVARNAFFN